MGTSLYSTGQFARKASVSVRTLRFYDRVGLLSPSRRTQVGYRQYTDEDLACLQQVLALKFLGFSLDEIKCFLATGPRGLQEVLKQQKAMMRERRSQVDAIIRAIEQAERLVRSDQSDWDSVVRVIEVIQMQQKEEWVDKYFTPEQQQEMAELSKRSYSDAARQKLAERGPWTEEDQKRADAQWAQVNSELKRLVAAGADPASPEAQAWAQSFNSLISAFTQNDPEVEAGLKTFWQSHATLPDDQKPMPSPYTAEEQRFLDKAIAISRG